MQNRRLHLFMNCDNFLLVKKVKTFATSFKVEAKRKADLIRALKRSNRQRKHKPTRSQHRHSFQNEPHTKKKLVRQRRNWHIDPDIYNSVLIKYCLPKRSSFIHVNIVARSENSQPKCYLCHYFLYVTVIMIQWYVANWFKRRSCPERKGSLIIKLGNIPKYLFINFVHGYHTKSFHKHTYSFLLQMQVNTYNW